MTGTPIRHTKFASWLDPDAWMETMQGPKWAQVLREEAANVQSYIQTPQVQTRVAPFQAMLQSANDQFGSVEPFDAGPIMVDWNSNFFKYWQLKGSDKMHEARDIVVSDEYVWTTRDIGDGAEVFQLECWSATNPSKQPIWTYKPVGPDIAVLGDKLFYLGVKNKLIYHEVWCCSAATGSLKRKLFTETNPSVNLSLEKQPNHRLLLIQDNSQDLTIQQIILQPNDKIQFKKQSERFAVPDDWILPVIGTYGIDALWPEQGLIILKQRGKKSLWKCTSNMSTKKLFQIPAGEIQWNPFSAWTNTVPTTVHVIQPSFGIGIYQFTGKDMQLLQPIQPTNTVAERVHTLSRDGSVVAGVVTFSKMTHPTKLLVIGYGAYGLPTAVGSVVTRWAPLLQSGWAIAHVFVRGGGDDTEEWAKDGRRAGREQTVEDFRAMIRHIQIKYHITAKHTAIYGRSAGGLLMGATLALASDGNLMRAVYTEVPYVDELRTTTNPSLPLTTLEYNEFGSPSIRLEDFISVARLSPADSATMIKTPNILVLTRTAEHDSQVFAYESVKWIRRLRQQSGAPTDAPKLCIVEKGQGHFTPPDATIQQWALDAAILDAWISNQ